MLSPFQELKEARENLLNRFSEGKVSESFQGDYSEIMDQYFRRSLQDSEAGHALFREKRPFAFIAVGGYSRHELCIHSDIDIIILFGSRIPDRAKQLSDEIFLPLWDLGLDLGYGIRTLKDCQSLCKSDFEVLTSMMHARFLCGDSPLYLSLVENLQKKVISKKAKAFGRWLEERNAVRMDKFGDASYLLEPNLKEGIGGLRDYHHILWLARAFFQSVLPRDLEYQGILSHSEYDDLKRNLRFIWLVRNHLHRLSGRRNDRLGFEYQEEIAGALGFARRGEVLAVEQFMGELHARMAAVKTLHRSFVSSHLPNKRLLKKEKTVQTMPKGLLIREGELNFLSATAITANPRLLLDIFEMSGTSGIPISMEAMRLIREFLYLVDEEFRSSRYAMEKFIRVLGAEYAPEAMNQMFETGFLEAYIPEFSPIRDRVQFDAYHIYPVERHCIEAVRHLKSLQGQKDLLLLDILAEIPHPERLLMAALFHDIGKVGKDHSSRGVAITQGILQRMGYSAEGTADILFLVRHHLLLAETATRRDLNDEKAVIQCARTIGDVDRLKMLYLLTWADSNATGPRAWNDWVANLAQELFFKILHILEKGELATPLASRKVEETQAEVQRLMDHQAAVQSPNGLFEVMSPRYLLNTSPRDIVRHVGMVHELRKRSENPANGAFVLDTRKGPAGSFWEVTFLGRDRPGLFSDIAGVLALNNVNILSADIYTWQDGTVVDIFTVSDPPDAIHVEEVWKRVERNLEDTFKGKLSLVYRLGQKSAPSILSRSDRPSRPPQVHMDNSSSDFFTLIEVFAEDKIGLLHWITKALFDLRLNIHVAKISTKVDQVADVFYVRDLEGQKVEDPAQVAEVERALLHQLKQNV